MRRPLLAYAVVAGVSGAFLWTAWPGASWSYPAFGERRYVSDAAPWCAGCHSSTDSAYHPELSTDAAEGELFTNKHYKALEEGGGVFNLLEADERRQLLERAKKIDENSSVTVEAPTSAAPGQIVTVTVTATGGIGPHVGIMLVDEPLRYQARPIQGAGWYIVAAPEVIGPKGPQTTWLDRRYNQQATNLNFALVYDVSADPERDSYPMAKVTYKLRAPHDPGEYTITAAFLYGTAEADEMKTGEYVNPPGGIVAPSGRVQFSDVTKVRVQ